MWKKQAIIAYINDVRNLHHDNYKVTYDNIIKSSIIKDTAEKASSYKYIQEIGRAALELNHIAAETVIIIVDEAIKALIQKNDGVFLSGHKIWN
jgi:hypothetical protein